MAADIIEIFSSIQGEGVYVGVRQIFLRLAGCNLSCNYCDTPVDITPHCRVELVSGTGVFREVPNPLSPVEAMDILNQLHARKHHSISLTGGEPLMSVSFLKELLPLIKDNGLPVYLETNGTLPDNLREIISQVDIVSMDIKLPGSTAGGVFYDRHREFLSVANQTEVFVKAVIAELTSDDEIRNTASLIKDINPAIPLVLQPVTPGAGNHIVPPGAKRVIDIQDLALNYLPDVRVIPQTHKFLGQL